MVRKAGTTRVSSYDTRNHCNILFQCYGSVFPRVISFCITNVLIMVAVKHISDRYGEYSSGLKISNVGHSFISLIVSFLLVSRVNTSLGRYNEARAYLGQMYRETRELTQLMVLLSRRDRNNDQTAKEWRSEVAYRSMILLRTAVAVMDYATSHIPAWDIPELSGTELQFAIDGHTNTTSRSDTFFSPGIATSSSRRTSSITSTISERSTTTMNNNLFLDSLRVPTRMAYLLRESICSQEERLTHPMHIQLENKLLSSVDSILQGYYGLRKLLTTPVPFPLVQMTKTIVWLYVFTLPFVLLSDEKSTTVAHCITIFIITYGFVGLELIAVELDDPFGNDENDFDCLAFAHTAFEDVYTTIRDSDGVEWADTLRYKMHDKSADPLPTEQSWLLSQVV